VRGAADGKMGIGDEIGEILEACNKCRLLHMKKINLTSHYTVAQAFNVHDCNVISSGKHVITV